jgi:hypothetical protein
MLGKTSHSSWQELLAQPEPGAHVVQLYDSDDFLAHAVGHYVAEGLHAGDAVMLSGTPAHWVLIRDHLAGLGLDVDGALRTGQLTAVDIERALPEVLDGDTVREAHFRSLVQAKFDRARHAGFRRLRWWGEMTGVLHAQGNPRPAWRLEELGDELARANGGSVLCSFRANRFDPAGYDDDLKELCRLHTHFVPAPDYVGHRMAVNRALAEVVGALDGPLLQSLIDWKGVSCDMPSSQAVLFWIRDTMPERLADVLRRALHYEQEAEARA